MKTEHLLQVTIEFVLFKSNCQKFNTLIQLGDQTIYSSLVEKGRLLMDQLPHSLLHFLVRMKPTSSNVFLQVAINVEVTRGKIWSVRRMLSVSQPNF